MASILWFGNVVNNDGFGRIGNELLKRLQFRGHTVGAAGVWTSHVPYGWPYQVWGLAGRDLFGELQSLCLAGCNGSPWDVLVACQDWAPYLVTVAQLFKIDYSRTALVGITPTDGAPIDEDWIAACPRFDALFTISRFGVETFAQQGGRDRYGESVALLVPGVDRVEFRPVASPEERMLLRQQAQITPPDAYMLGAFMANQGRKCWPETLELFGRFRRQVPTAVLLADTDRHSPAGWRLDVLARHIAAYRGLPPFDQAILYREDLQRRGLVNLRDRYALCDVALQLAFREGYGLPIAEAQSVGCLTLAQEWCSGRELCGNGRGLLCRSREGGRFGTWGNALDKDPDLDHALELLLDAYEHPGKAAAIRETAAAAVKGETWDSAAELLDERIRQVLARREAARRQYAQQQAPQPQQPTPASMAPTSVSPPMPPRAGDALPLAAEPGTDGLAAGGAVAVPQ